MAVAKRRSKRLGGGGAYIGLVTLEMYFWRSFIRYGIEMVGGVWIEILETWWSGTALLGVVLGRWKKG